VFRLRWRRRPNVGGRRYGRWRQFCEVLFPSVEITNDDESVSWSSNVSGLSLPLCLVINIDQLALFFGGAGSVAQLYSCPIWATSPQQPKRSYLWCPNSHTLGNTVETLLPWSQLGPCFTDTGGPPNFYCGLSGEHPLAKCQHTPACNVFGGSAALLYSCPLSGLCVCNVTDSFVDYCTIYKSAF